MPKRAPWSKRPTLAAKMAKTLRERAHKRAEAGVPTNSSRMSKEERLKAGLRPRNPSKPDVWAKLSKQSKLDAIVASKLHAERQLRMGIPRDQIYGPYAVIEWGARWEDKLTPTTHV